MAEVVKQFDSNAAGPGGRTFIVKACARQSEDGRWEGWLEFDAGDGSHVLRTPRETTQPSRDAVVYWANGLSPVYLEGALARTHRPERRAPRTVATSAYDAPADDFSERIDPSPPARPDSRPILDPFEVYAQGEEILRQELTALDPSHLRTLLQAYTPVADEVDLATMSRVSLAELLVAAVKKQQTVDGRR
jgi:hypothetical protein